MEDRPEEVLSFRYPFEGRLVRLRVEEVRLPSGRLATREIVEHRGAVAMVPVTDQNEVLLVRQYRRALDSWTLEIPAGTLEPGETVEACLHRELGEELGMEADRVEFLLAFFPSPGFLTERVHLYLCTGLRPRPGPQGDEEVLHAVRVPLPEALRMIGQEIQDAKSILGILLAAGRRGVSHGG
ncbi:MAG: NUDIX hydrolase [Armatimonadota bacterium]|nr:NUDIX hydrolase [Armatimonadota bacterium]MDR7440119.1 NUDIX hydrolase [Armatimonadota bacterium]MDR7562612.1 NUDIX hydrolase [Armatimonadota bacterium]MDR7567983.1 NUDIX hydrolase [Armatimonadota bacterium]MDR7602907.1 NUDIX hydrolase [Armatimonadota bacterium]